VRRFKIGIGRRTSITKASTYLGWLWIGTVGCGAALPAQSDTGASIAYAVSFDNAVHHEARISVVFSDVPAGPLEIRMSRTSPGRYALHEFAKNVYDVSITDGAGNTLVADRPDLHQWTVDGHDGTVRFDYTLFADRRDGTYAAVGPDGAMLNIPATLVWARGWEERAARVAFHLP